MPGARYVQILLLAACMSGLPGKTRGAAFDGSVVAASAAWWSHLNVETFARSATGRALLATPGQPLLHQANAFAATTGIAPFRDLRHVTLYGPDQSGARGVAIMDGVFQATNLVKRLQSQAGYTSHAIYGLTVHRWHNPAGAGAPQAACLPTPQRLLLATDETLLLAALAVLRGKAPSWTAQSGPLPLPRLAPPGVFLQAAARGCPGGLAGTLPGTLLRDVAVIAGALSEAGGQTQMDLQFYTASEAAAVQLEQLANGLILTGAISQAAGTGATAPPWTRLMSGAVVTRRAATVQIHCACPPSEAANLLSKCQE